MKSFVGFVCLWASVTAAAGQSFEVSAAHALPLASAAVRLPPAEAALLPARGAVPAHSGVETRLSPAPAFLVDPTPDAPMTPEVALRLRAEFTPARYGTAIGDESIRRWKRHWAISAVAMIAASVADAASSWGKTEANPLLRQGGGQFGGRSAVIKLGIGILPLVVQYAAARSNETLYRPFAIANYGGAALFTGIAVRNAGISAAVQ